MKRMWKLLAAVLVISVLLTAGWISASAEGTESYTIRLYAGNRGTGDGSITVEPGFMVDLDGLLANVQVTDEKFYKRGVAKAGYDTATLGEKSFTAVEDADYVVVYGVKGDMVRYTVRYISTTGAALAEESVGYANAGEKIVVGCKDVDGYVPNTYNYAMTLSENEAANVFTFVYTRIPTAEEVAAAQAAAQAAAAGGNGAAAGENGTATSEGVTIGQIAQPAQIIDLDEQEVPLAEMAEGQVPGSIGTPLLVGAGVAFVGLLALVLVLAKKNKDKNRGYET